MKVCKTCGKELSEESLYYDYINDKGEMEHIFLCNDCLDGHGEIAMCAFDCFTYVPTTTKFRFRSKPICKCCAKWLVENSIKYSYEKDLADIKHLEKALKENSI